MSDASAPGKPSGQPEPALFPLWHLALGSDWEAAQASGVYEVATRGRTLAEEGFIHCSYPHQLGPVARQFYADVADELLILELDRDALASHGVPVFVDRAPALGGQTFPHVYGVIRPEDVTQVIPVAFDEGGGLVLGTPEAAS